MTTLLLDSPDVATFRRNPRNRAPYRQSLNVMFARATPAERNLYRWLYREFREQEHSTPFSARALVFTFVVKAEYAAVLKGRS